MAHIPEKRRFQREAISAPIWMIKDENALVIRAQTNNLSCGGICLFVEDPSILYVGQEVRVRMVLPNTFVNTNSFCSVDTPAKIIWASPFAESNGQIHMGLAFKKPISFPLLAVVS